jgi:hypothetical protein
MDIHGRHSVLPLVAVTLLHLFDAYLYPLNVSHIHSASFIAYLGLTCVV